MDALKDFLLEFKEHHPRGHFLGLLHLLIGRGIAKGDGTVLANGLTWRELAALLKAVRWDKDDIRELGLNPEEMAPRDRERFWYTAILRAGIDSPHAREAAEQLADALRKRGYIVSSSPGK